MKYAIEYTAQFKRDFKRISRQKRDAERLLEALRLLAEGETLAESFRDHSLGGGYHGHRECHIRPDLLLIYRIDEGILTLTAVRTGSHAELFNM